MHKAFAIAAKEKKRYRTKLLAKAPEEGPPQEHTALEQNIPTHGNEEDSIDMSVCTNPFRCISTRLIKRSSGES
jgi:hypothetical protein